MLNRTLYNMLNSFYLWCYEVAQQELKCEGQNSDTLTRQMLSLMFVYIHVEKMGCVILCDLNHGRCGVQSRQPVA